MRIESNSLLLKDSVDLDDLSLENVSEHFINPNRIIEIPKMQVTAKQGLELQQGKFLSLDNSFNFQEELIQCIGESDEFIGIASAFKKKSGEFLIKPKVIV